MIISASYKTDIPTFYGEWFMNRLREGYCGVVNPYNRRASRVSLRREDVHGIVFWTKNLAPFFPRLQDVARLHYPFVVQYTINGYPRELESAVVDGQRSVDYFRRSADLFGPNVCVWRYDTIVISSLTDEDFHRRNFEGLASQLEGATDEVVVSFAHFYQKTLRNMNEAARSTGFTWVDPNLEAKKRLLQHLQSVAEVHGMRLGICSQPSLLVPGAIEARCVDADRFERITGSHCPVRQRGNRKECGCFESKDIGEYDTCPHGCVYCYAVRTRALAQRRFRQHDPSGEFLFPPDDDVQAEEVAVDHQPRLFN